jgi:hypothetical protein
MKRIVILVLAMVCLQNLLGQKNIAKSSSTGNFYFFRYVDALDEVQFASGSTDNIGYFNVISKFVEDSKFVTEATMDDEGNYYGATSDFGALVAKRNGSVPGNEINGMPRGSKIYKLDKSTGAILKIYNIDLVGGRIYGLAYNHADGLIYFLCEDEDDFVSKASPLARRNPQPKFFSISPETGVIRLIRQFEEYITGLGCTNDGIFYTAVINHDDYSLAKFTLNSTLQICQTMNTAEFAPDEIFDLEIDRNTEKCYCITANSESENFELREINTATGITTLKGILGDSDNMAAGLAFEKINNAGPLNSAKYIITSPNGGENLKKGTYQNITWRRIGGIIQGSVDLDYSTNGGSTWKRINTAPIAGIFKYSWLVPDEVSGNCLVRMVNHLTRAEYDRSDSRFSIIGNGVEAAEKPVNYPNPFNPSTKISFSIEKSSQVSLKVFNSIGQQVTELVNSQLEAGKHEFLFNAVNLPSGVYMYKLEIDGVSQMHKMILMK